LFLALLLPITLSATARDTVRIDGSKCVAGSAFTITIPVKLSPDDTAFYKWYCNGKYIANSDSIATSTNRKITYTIPPNSNYSGDVVFHFTYRLNDDCEEWTSSPRYVISFAAICPPTPGVVGVEDYICVGVTTAGTVGVDDYSCVGVSTAGTVGVANYSCVGVTTAGTIGVREY